LSRIFEPDEVAIEVDPAWTREELLQKEGYFKFGHIQEKLGISCIDIHSAAKRVRSRGHSVYATIGVRSFWNNWYVRMKVFAPYYRDNIEPKQQKIPEDLDSFLKDPPKKVYILSNILQALDQPASVLRHFINIDPSPRETMGIWRNMELGKYVCYPNILIPWLSDNTPYLLSRVLERDQND